jgi:phosphoribosylformylglycinamidine synthase subunit PurL
LLGSARDLSDGGIAVALAQAAFEKGIGARVEQEKSLMGYPLFGLFAEPASTMLLSAAAKNAGAIAELAEEYGFLCARIGTTGGDGLEISVYSDRLISAPLSEIRTPWATALQAVLHDEVTV